MATFYNPDILRLSDVDIWGDAGRVDYAQMLRIGAKEQKKQRSYGWMYIVLAVLLLVLAVYVLKVKGIIKFKK